MTKLKIVTLFMLLGSISLHANATDQNVSKKIELQSTRHSIKNLSDVLSSGGLVTQQSIAEKHNFEQRTIANVDMGKISSALDVKGMNDIKNCGVHLSDEQFYFVSIENYQTLLSHINMVLTEKYEPSVPSKDSCFELLQFIF